MLQRLRDAKKRLDRLEGKVRPSRNRTAQPGDTFSTWDDLRAEMVTPYDGKSIGTERIIGISTDLLESGGY